MLGQERVRAGLIRPPRAPPDASPKPSSCSNIPTSGPRRRVGDLGVGAQQLVEVARALVSQRAGHRLRRADQLARRARRHAALRDHRPAARPRAGDRLHQPFPGGSPPGRPDVHRPARRPSRRRRASWPERRSSRSSPTWSAATSTSSSRACRITAGEPILELEDLRVRKTAAAGEPGAAARGDPGHRGAGRRGPDQAVARRLRARADRLGAGRASGTSQGGYAPPGGPHRAGARLPERGPQGRGPGPGPLDRGQHDLLRPRAARALGLAAAQGAPRRGRALDRAAADRVRRGPARPPATSRAATSRKWPWRGCSISRPTSCSWTSRPAASTSAPRPRSIA